MLPNITGLIRHGSTVLLLPQERDRHEVGGYGRDTGLFSGGSLARQGILLSTPGANKNVMLANITYPARYFTVNWEGVFVLGR
jgi:hypothetical protein